MRWLGWAGASRALLSALLSALLLLTPLPCSAVDRKKFRTCQDTAFCRRNRLQSATEQRQPRYDISPGSVRVDSSAAVLTASVRPLRHPLQPLLSLRLSVLSAGVVQLQIREPAPLHPRWEVQDVIEPAVFTSHPAVSFSSSASETRASWTLPAAGNESAVSCELLLLYSPLSVRLSVGGSVSAVFNSRGLLHYEQYRERNPRPQLSHEEPAADPAAPPAVSSRPAPDADPLTAAFPYDEDGMWEEQFGGHSDSKRFGPASVSADFSFPAAQQLYGLPEHASSFALRSTQRQRDGDYGEPYRLFNLDVFEYELNEPMALYGAVPFLVAHRAEGSTGLLWLNSAETFIDLTDSASGGGLLSSGSPQKDSHWISESGIIDAFLLPGPTPAALFAQYAQLTGHSALPRYFAIGYHQCRWNYKSEEDVLAVDAGFDQHDIPYDVIWLDIEHTDGKKYFTWDGSNFPHPQDMQRALAAKQRQLVTIVDPHMKRDSNWPVHTNALEKGLYVQSAGGGAYEGWCWPGSVSYLDFLDPAVRQYWAEQFALERYAGSTERLFVWNDMNEPSVFNGPEVTMPKDCRHLHASVEHRDVHNLYGHFNLLSTAQGLRQRDGKRPFVLSRSFFAGSQKHAAVWTGDNAADWSHLAASVPMLLSLGVAGISFAGADVGGFFKDPSAELLVRWYQLGAYQPFFRGHAHIDTKRREPWLMGDPYTACIRRAIKQRYALLPYLYTAFHEAATSGLPVMRPLWLHFPTDAALFAEESEFMLGPAVLVAPVTAAGASSLSVYLPAGVWYDAQTLQQASWGHRSVPVTLDSIPVFYRGGQIIARKDRARRSSRLMAADPLTLVVALDAELNASGRLYLDDGESFDYQRGDFALRLLTASAGRELRCEAVSGSGGRLRSDLLIERIVLVGMSRPLSSAAAVTPAGEKRPLSISRARDGSWIIRKPELRATDDWSIALG